MSFNSILTVGSIIIAIYSIMPKYKKLELKTKSRRIDFIIFTIFILVVHYLLYYNIFVNFNLNLGFGLSKYGVTPANSLYMLFIIMFLYLFLRIKYGEIPTYKIDVLKLTLEELQFKENYNELIYLLSSNMNVLRKILNFNISKKKNKLEDFLSDDFENSKTKNKKINKIKSSLFKIFNDNKIKKQESVEELLRILFTDENFIRNLIKIKPYFALDLVKLEKNYYTNNFLETFLNFCILDPKSILYKELDETSYISTLDYDQCEKKPNNDNEILFFLFNDISVAKEYEVYRPIGEGIISTLLEMRRTDNDKFNEPYENEDEELLEKNPIVKGRKFFVYMIYNSILQEIDWHMWLYYYYYFVKEICINYNPNKYVNLDDEFPTKYNYILYLLFSDVRDWIKSIEYLNEENNHAKIEIDRVEHQNDNIIISSIILLGRMLAELINNRKITKKFKEYMLSISFDLYYDLINKKENVARLLIKSIMHGGTELMSLKKKHLGFIIRYLMMSRDIIVRGNGQPVKIIAKEFLVNFSLDDLNTYVNAVRDNEKIILRSSYCQIEIEAE
ncbi:hypothetical protein C8C76_11724 [Halanaerobium saccharolyticum]|uniref:Uncharacterized protein n=1 Tax=Halanaerobium saccharolyticum TaxID=43595 RepID=A0A2T5RIX1_9FIRM|nr:hypothetical protein [Halanaerobium saccharolyticum]PTV98367.1 hypothetical protein C8C76_11724 [Halanaerobium saccharolyticum]